MNPFQRTGIFLLRIVGLLAVLIGLLGLGYVLGVAADAMEVAAANPPSLVASVLWLAVGIGLLLAAGPIGRWLGRGLE